MSLMSDDSLSLLGWWVRNNRNVIVRVIGHYSTTDGVDTVHLIFKNGHRKRMPVKDFKYEFLNYNELLKDITVGSEWRWDAIDSITITVTDVNIRTGRIRYKIHGVPEKYSEGSDYLYRFKNEKSKIS